MTKHSTKILGAIAAATLVIASALPAAAQRHQGGGGGGGGGIRAGGGGGAHFSGSRGAMPRAAVHSRAVTHSRTSVHQRSGMIPRAHAQTRSRTHAQTSKARHAQQVRQQAHKQDVRKREAQQNRREQAQNRREVRGRNQARTAAATQQHRARVNAREARQGRFAARYYGRNGRVAYRPWRWAWRNGWYAGFVPWYGPVFWPYAYADIFAFTFWPYGYAPGYWAYAYDDFFDGVFWGYDGAPAGYAYAPEAVPRSSANRATKVSTASVQELCKQPGSGITAWPFDDIVNKVNLNAEQKQLLDDMKAASQKAAEDFAASCPQDATFAATPPARLEAMTARIGATLQAVGTVKPSLEKFYASLSDEQKERFNELGPKNNKVASRKRAETQGSGGRDQASANCGDPKPGLANLPIERIENAVHPTEAQQSGLRSLEDATNKAVATLQGACPDEIAMTPTGRLEAMEMRLKAMLEAASTVKPALEEFYGSLDDEQKARFNKLGRQIASND